MKTLGRKDLALNGTVWNDCCLIKETKRSWEVLMEFRHLEELESPPLCYSELTGASEPGMALLTKRKGWAVQVFIVCLNCKISVRLYPEFNKFMNNHPVLYWGVRSLTDVEEMVTATYGCTGHRS